jgi:hypothetical protein
VPEIALRLAEACDQVQEGPLASFHMSDADRYEFKIAALLHDCGKVTTPVHVVDKSTKLETIFDRIHLIDTRFEVIRRDIQIELLQQQLLDAQQVNQDTNGQEDALRQKLEQVNSDQAFLRQCNNRQPKFHLPLSMPNFRENRPQRRTKFSGSLQPSKQSQASLVNRPPNHQTPKNMARPKPHRLRWREAGRQRPPASPHVF